MGYLSDYPQGVRENGGQYTHAVMWYLIALTVIGEQDKAFELFQMINPVEKCANELGNRMYMGEPYVLSGDVYVNADQPGRCGWTWYTGSATWAYKLVTEYFYGIKVRGNRLFIQPKLPKKLIGSTLIVRYKNSTYAIEYRSSLVSKIYADGVETKEIVLEENIRKSVTVEIGFYSE